jgi:hypothetical protein
LKEESTGCGAAVISGVTTALGVERFARLWIAIISGESGLLAEVFVCAIPSGATAVSITRVFKQRDSPRFGRNGTVLDDEETLNVIECSFEICAFREIPHTAGEVWGFSSKCALLEGANV